MAKREINPEEAGTQSEDERHGVNYITDLRGKLVKCIGDVCFSDGDDGEIIVNIDKSKSPECAQYVSEYLLAKKRVRFDLGEQQVI